MIQYCNKCPLRLSCKQKKLGSDKNSVTKTTISNSVCEICKVLNRGFTTYKLYRDSFCINIVNHVIAII